MERLRERLKTAREALSTLEELTRLARHTDVERDAAIQRFEYSFEATWKAAQRFLLLREGLAVGSPKACVRAALQVGVLTEEEAEQALEMADDRNLTVHTYNEELARTILRRLPRHAGTMSTWLAKMEAALGDLQNREGR